MALALQRLDLVADLPRLFLAVPGRGDAHLLALRPLGPECLAETSGILGDQAGSGGKDMRRRAVVLLQANHLGAGKILLEFQDVLDLGAAPAIDRLVVVADHAEIAVALGQQA